MAGHSTQLCGAITQLDDGHHRPGEPAHPQPGPLEQDVGHHHHRRADRSTATSPTSTRASASRSSCSARPAASYDPTYNWLNLNNQLPPGVTGDYVAGLVRDRLAGVCRRILANDADGPYQQRDLDPGSRAATRTRASSTRSSSNVANSLERGRRRPRRRPPRRRSPCSSRACRRFPGASSATRGTPGPRPNRARGRRGRRVIIGLLGSIGSRRRSSGLVGFGHDLRPPDPVSAGRQLDGPPGRPSRRSPRPTPPGPVAHRARPPGSSPRCHAARRTRPGAAPPAPSPPDHKARARPRPPALRSRLVSGRLGRRAPAPEPLVARRGRLRRWR